MKRLIVLLFLLAVVFINTAILAQDEAENYMPQEVKMKLTSPAFENNAYMPAKYTCEGEEVNPPLTIEVIPEGTKSLALIMDDPDAPAGTWVHWVVYDIPVVSKIEEDSIPGTQGANDSNPRNYGGPCPPSGTHRYVFKIYALDINLNLPEGISKKELEKKMEGHMLAKAELIGLYKRKGR